MASTLKTPLIYQNDPVKEWLYAHINEEPRRKDCLDYTKIVSKYALAIIATLRNAAFIPLSLELPYGKWAFATGNVLGTTALDYWAGSRFIEDFFPNSHSLKKRFPTNPSSISEKVATVFNVLISLLSQIPAVYPAIEYNKKSYAIPVVMIVTLGGAVIPLRSIQLMIQNHFQGSSAKNKNIDPCKKEKFLSLLKSNQQKFIKDSNELRMLFIEDLKSIRKKADSPEKIKEYFSKLLCLKNPQAAKTLSGSAYYSTQGARALGIALAGIYQSALAIYTFKKTKEIIYNNDIFAGFFSAVIVGSSAYLSSGAMIQSAVKVFHSLTGIGKDLYDAKLIEKLKPKTMGSLHVLGQIVNLLSLGVSYTIWNDFFKNKTGKTFFETTICLGVFLFLFAAIPDVINDSMEQMALFGYGTHSEKKQIQLAREYEKLIDSIEMLSPEDFEKVLPFLPDELISAIESNPFQPQEPIRNPLTSKKEQSIQEDNNEEILGLSLQRANDIEI